MASKNLSLLVALAVYLSFMLTLWLKEPAFINPLVAIFSVVSTALVMVVLLVRMAGPSG